MSLRVVVAEDAYLVREGLVRLLGDGDDVEVVAAVSDGPSLLEAASGEGVEAVLTDIRMPPGYATEGIDAARELRRRSTSIGVVVLSQHIAGSYALDLFAEGTAGLAYLLKERVGDREELVRALNITAGGGSVIDPHVVEHLLARERRLRNSALRELTDREQDVLALMAQGRTNPAIAEQLFVSESAVSKHVATIFAKLGLQQQREVDRRVQAVLTYLSEQRPG